MSTIAIHLICLSHSKSSDFRAKKKAENSDTMEERRLKNQGKRKQRHERDLKQFPCKKLKFTGTCELGEDCRYSHDIDSANRNNNTEEEAQMDSST